MKTIRIIAICAVCAGPEFVVYGCAFDYPYRVEQFLYLLRVAGAEKIEFSMGVQN